MIGLLPSIESCACADHTKTGSHLWVGSVLGAVTHLSDVVSCVPFDTKRDGSLLQRRGGVVTSAPLSGITCYAPTDTKGSDSPFYVRSTFDGLICLPRIGFFEYAGIKRGDGLLWLGRTSDGMSLFIALSRSSPSQYSRELG